MFMRVHHATVVDTALQVFGRHVSRSHVYVACVDAGPHPRWYPPPHTSTALSMHCDLV